MSVTGEMNLALIFLDRSLIFNQLLNLVVFSLPLSTYLWPHKYL